MSLALPTADVPQQLDLADGSQQLLCSLTEQHVSGTASTDACSRTGFGDSAVFIGIPRSSRLATLSVKEDGVPLEWTQKFDAPAAPLDAGLGSGYSARPRNSRRTLVGPSSWPSRVT